MPKKRIVETVCTARVTMARQRPTRIATPQICNIESWWSPRVCNVDMDVFVDLSINLKEDGNQDAFTYINGPGLDRVVITDFQGSSANSVGGDSGRTDGQEDGDQYNIHTLLKARG
ncbi:hypothetical protein DPMN_052857 [Dreissena polymorpha]|uniref:Uncharacterized protein n=1 Tax=Dreissena polymorpha TaxID=45954 RepID=A0A9D4CM89_DREPO|nr:hypothetical protein DPMN_052857 [Dreissena polymorpha]